MPLVTVTNALYFLIQFKYFSSKVFNTPFFLNFISSNEWISRYEIEVNIISVQVWTMSPKVWY